MTKGGECRDVTTCEPRGGGVLALGSLSVKVAGAS